MPGDHTRTFLRFFSRLEAWLAEAETQRRLEQAAEGACLWLQDPTNRPDEDLRCSRNPSLTKRAF